MQFAARYSSIFVQFNDMPTGSVLGGALSILWNRLERSKTWLVAVLFHNFNKALPDIVRSCVVGNVAYGSYRSTGPIPSSAFRSAGYWLNVQTVNVRMLLWVLV